MVHHSSTLASISDSGAAEFLRGVKHKVALAQQLCIRNYNGVDIGQP